MNKNKQTKPIPWWEDSAAMDAALANRSTGTPIYNYSAGNPDSRVQKAPEPTDLDSLHALLKGMDRVRANHLLGPGQTHEQVTDLTLAEPAPGQEVPTAAKSQP